MAHDHQWIATVCLVSSSIIAVVANLLLIVVFFRRRGLRTVSNRFVINLLITNLLSSLLIIPLLILDQDSTYLHKEKSTNNLTEVPSNISSFLSVLNITDQSIVEEHSKTYREENLTTPFFLKLIEKEEIVENRKTIENSQQNTEIDSINAEYVEDLEVNGGSAKNENIEIEDVSFDHVNVDNSSGKNESTTSEEIDETFSEVKREEVDLQNGEKKFEEKTSKAYKNHGVVLMSRSNGANFVDQKLVVGKEAFLDDDLKDLKKSKREDKIKNNLETKENLSKIVEVTHNDKISSFVNINKKTLTQDLLEENAASTGSNNSAGEQSVENVRGFEENVHFLQKMSDNEEKRWKNEAKDIENEKVFLQNKYVSTQDKLKEVQTGDILTQHKERHINSDEVGDGQLEELKKTVRHDEEFLDERKTINTELVEDKLIIKTTDVSDSNVIEESVSGSTHGFEQSEYHQSIRVFLCYFAEFCTTFVCTASIFSILLIGIDQYFAVIHSLRYHSYIDKFRSLVLILSSWLIALFFATIGVLTKSEISVWTFCLGSNDENKPKMSIIGIIYVFAYFVLVILVPFVLICVIYVCIYTAAHKNSKRMRKSTSSQGSSSVNFDKYCEKPEQKLLQKVHSAPTFVSFEQVDNVFNGLNTPEEHDVKSDSDPSKMHNNVLDDISDNSEYICLKADKNFNSDSPKKEVTYVASTTFLDGSPKEENDCDNMNSLVLEKTRKVSRAYSERVATSIFNSLRYKISNSSLFRYREETRAAKISILVIVMVLICYLPYGVALIINTGLFNIDRPLLFNYISLVLLIASNVASPFLFAYRNRRIQRELWKFFGFSPPKLGSSNISRRGSVKVFNNVIKEDKVSAPIDDDVFDKNDDAKEPFLPTLTIPSVVIDVSPAKKSILKRVCSKNWPNYKNCNFITVPDSCLGAEARGSFSSASTQISTEE